MNLNDLIIACIENVIIGVMHITFTPYITHQGEWRATIKGVRTAASTRNKGVGTELIPWAIKRAEERKCHLVQLTTSRCSALL
jgi:GNAT superfamily N-acetyltransferase